MWTDFSFVIIDNLFQLAIGDRLTDNLNDSCFPSLVYHLVLSVRGHRNHFDISFRFYFAEERQCLSGCRPVFLSKQYLLRHHIAIHLWHLYVSQD